MKEGEKRAWSIGILMCWVILLGLGWVVIQGMMDVISMQAINRGNTSILHCKMAEKNSSTVVNSEGENPYTTIITNTSTIATDTPTTSNTTTTTTNPTTTDDDDDDDSTVITATSDTGSTIVAEPMGYPHYTFLKMSTYRESLRTFCVIGATSVLARGGDRQPPVRQCIWHSKSNQNKTSDAITDAVVHYVRYDENGALYVPAVVNCTFKDDISKGGQLSLVVTGGSARLRTATGLALEEKEEEEEDEGLVKSSKYTETGAQTEEAAAVNRNGTVAEEEAVVNLIDTVTQEAVKRNSVVNDQPRFEYAYCGPPMHGNVDARWILEWMTYHHYLWEGKAHFFFYNNPLLKGAFTHEHRQILSPFLNAGLLTILDVPWAEDRYPTWYHNQLLYANDCLHRLRGTARWAFFHDFDEVLYVAPPLTLPGLVALYRDSPWITFGSLPRTTGQCRPGTDEWPLQRMVWRHKTPDCRRATIDPWNCLGATGHRKYALQPSKVYLTGVHEVAIPREGGVHLNASIASVHHFYGIFTERVQTCRTLVNGRQEEDRLNSRYDLDDGIANSTKLAREFASPLFSSQD